MPNDENIFPGTSNKGDVSEAIDAAANSAKNALGTSYVEFTIASIVGKFGGFVDQRHLTVNIQVSGTEPSVR